MPLIVGFAHARFPDGEGTPPRSRARAVDGLSPTAYHFEDPPDHGHVLRLHLVAITGLVVAEAVAWRVAADDLSLPGLPQLPPAAALRSLRALELGELVEDAVRELTLRGIVAAVVERTQLGAVFIELPSEEVSIRRFPAETVPVLSEHGRSAPGGYQVPHMIHARPLQAGTTIAGVRDLF
jgi:hypothetical protein